MGYIEINLENVMKEVEAKKALRKRLYGIEIDAEMEAEMIIEAVYQLQFSNKCLELCKERMAVCK